MGIGRHLARYATGTHTWLYRATNGRVGGWLGKADAVLLITIGRSTGRPRTTPLLCVPDGDRVVVIASAAGSTNHPDWYQNLVADSHVEVEQRGTRRPMIATIAQGDERERLWTAATALYKGYDRYQRKTSRTIPVVILTPDPDRNTDSRTT